MLLFTRFVDTVINKTKGDYIHFLFKKIDCALNERSACSRNL